VISNVSGTLLNTDRLSCAFRAPILASSNKVFNVIWKGGIKSVAILSKLVHVLPSVVYNMKRAL
jgi:hypothetical protein